MAPTLTFEEARRLLEIHAGIPNPAREQIEALMTAVRICQPGEDLTPPDPGEDPFTP